MLAKLANEVLIRVSMASETRHLAITRDVSCSSLLIVHRRIANRLKGITSLRYGSICEFG